MDLYNHERVMMMVSAKRGSRSESEGGKPRRGMKWRGGKGRTDISLGGEGYR